MNTTPVRTRLLLALAPLVFAMLGASPASGQAPCVTTVPGGLVAGQTWRATRSPYCVTGDIQVSLLTIEPGVQVLVDGPYAIDVLSTITAVGTAEAPILFTARSPQTPWHGLKFQNTPAGSQLDYCRFEYSSDRAISLQNTASISIAHSTFQNNSATGVNGGALGALGTSGLVIEQCQFIDNAINPNLMSPNQDGSFLDGGGAVWLRDGDASLTDSVFTGNQATGLCVGGFHCTETASGGALLVDGSASVAIQRTAFAANSVHSSSQYYNNTAHGYGGAVYVNSGSVTLSNSTLACNSASAYVPPGTCCSFAAVGGLALYVAGGTTTLEGTAIARNASGAAAVQLGGGALEIQDSIVYFNNGDQAQIAGNPTVTYSDVEAGFTGTGNINLNPVFAGTGCTADDLKIVAGSPAIDAGNPDPQYNDMCFPPSQGGARNDMGFTGGPGACGGLPPTPSTSTTTSTTPSSSTTSTSTSTIRSTTTSSTTTTTTTTTTTSTTATRLTTTTSTTSTTPTTEQFVPMTTTTLLTVVPPTACPDAAASAAIEAAIEAQCNCLGAANHGAFVRCAAGLAKKAVKTGTLSKQCKSAVIDCASRSTCGKPGFVTCCRTTAKGKTRCSIKRDGAHCKATKHGTACAGQRPSCCDACVSGGCAAPSLAYPKVL